MSQNETTNAKTEDTTKAAAKKTAPKKSAPSAKPEAKAPAKKATKPTESKSETPKNNSGLKKPQQRILKFLESQSEPMSRAAIAEFAPVDVAACVEYIGSHIEEKRLANDAKHFPSLISLGLVKFAMPEEGARGVVYSITAKGKQLAAKIVVE